MHKISVLSLAFLAGFVLLVSSCNKTTINPSIGNWIFREEFGGNARSEAVSFVIHNDSAYVTTGYDFLPQTYPQKGDTLGRYYDMWQYQADPSEASDKAGNWTQEADFIGSARSSAVAFSIGDTGYVGTGFDNFSNNLSDFYAYDAPSNTWTREADFIGTGRYDAVGFALKGRGYIATGFDGGYNSDCYQYNPNTGTWIKTKQFPGPKRSQAVAFVSNDTTAFICTGSNNGNTSVCNDLWAMTTSTSNPDSIIWTERRHITNFDTQSYDDLYAMIRQNAVAFVVDDLGFAFLTTGNNGAERTDNWEYDVKKDLWYQETSFEGIAREGAVGFSIDNRGFVGTGRSSATNAGQFDDFREFLPLQAYNALD
ncbi:MAG TPA: hypothetical protein VK718_02925 [Ferruginibacter sp.]|jgi:N-acetylneuraminic acid mutarotase|nr:hypothetical protein [Ferruginibacter sp.]